MPHRIIPADEFEEEIRKVMKGHACQGCAELERHLRRLVEESEDFFYGCAGFPLEEATRDARAYLDSLSKPK